MAKITLSSLCLAAVLLAAPSAADPVSVARAAVDEAAGGFDAAGAAVFDMALALDLSPVPHEAAAQIAARLASGGVDAANRATLVAARLVLARLDAAAADLIAAQEMLGIAREAEARRETLVSWPVPGASHRG